MKRRLKALLKRLMTRLLKDQNMKLAEMERRLLAVEKNVRHNNDQIYLINHKDDIYTQIDYGSFEEHFRGSRECIIDRQKEYLPYFKDKKHVLDLGCGRGEFLEVMKEHNIHAVGVDIYMPFIEECREKGLEVHQADAIEYLKGVECVDGIFVAQLIEHISVSQILELCRLAKEKLAPGGCLIMESPNPMTLAIFTHAFYIDPSHNKPVHPLTLQYYVQLCGFTETKILFTEKSRLPESIPLLEGENIVNIEAFNQSIKELNEVLYGSQDYAVIAIK